MFKHQSYTSVHYDCKGSSASHFAIVLQEDSEYFVQIDYIVLSVDVFYVLCTLFNAETMWPAICKPTFSVPDNIRAVMSKSFPVKKTITC